MARLEKRLKALNVARAKKPGMYADGGGLYLQVSDGGAKSWIYRYSIDTRQRYMGLGPFPVVSLEIAREMRDECRRLLKINKVDPIEARKDALSKAKIEAARSVTFKDEHLAYIEAHRADWQNPKHIEQWTNSIATYVYPVFGEVPVQDVDTALVVKALEPIWSTKPETASRVRGRIEAILNRAKTLGYRTGENPARWRGHLEYLLASQPKAKRVKHLAALPYQEIGTFIAALHERESTAARALELLILTAVRTGEVIGARWSEFDLDNALWVIPAERMKARREHSVPLCDRAVAIVMSMRELRQDDDNNGFVFPSAKKGKSLSNMAMLKLLERMGRSDLTVHGFRSSFRDWTAEVSNFPNEVAEMALAHIVADETERAYRRGVLFAKRIKLMQAWEKYCTFPPRSRGNVVPMKKKIG